MRILTVQEDIGILRAKSRPVAKIDAELIAFLRDLGKTLKDQKDPAGVGLSAVQVGRLIRAFATFLPESKKPKLVFYINPEIVDHSNEMTLGEDLVEDSQSGGAGSRSAGQQTTNNQRPFLEGCLSIPDIYGPVLRWPWVKATAVVLSESDLRSPLALSPHPLSLTLDALTSRVFQHELDHLNGILFTDHVLAQGNRLYQDSGNGLEEVNL